MVVDTIKNFPFIGRILLVTLLIIYVCVCAFELTSIYYELYKIFLL